MGAEGTDAHLLERARAGDTEAYVSLFGRHHPHALATATDLAGVDAADDVVAEAFVRILACLDEGGGPRQTFTPYLDLTLHRAAVDHLSRDRGPEAGAATPAVSVLQPSDPRAARTPELATFSQLTPQAQMALWLRDLDEVPTAEVAELLGVDAGVADQLAQRAGAAFSAAHPGPLAPALLALHQPAATAPVGTLTLVPPLTPTATEAAAGGVAAAARWRRWAPGVAAAAIVAIVASLAVTTLGRGPVDELTQQEAAVAPPTVGQDQPFRDFDLHGGRIAPAMLGGLVNADVDAVAMPVEESTEADDAEAANAVEETDGNTQKSPRPSEQGTETTPGRDDEQDDPEPPVNAPPEKTPQNVSVSSTGVETTGTRGSAVARFAVDNLASGGQFKFTLTGEQAEIQSVSGGGDCTVQGKTATCTFAGGNSAQLVVTVIAPQGGSISVTAERNDESSASATAVLPKPVEEAGDVDDTPPTTPNGGPDGSSPDDVDTGN